MDLNTIKNQLRAAYDKDSTRRSDTDYIRDQWKLDFREKFVKLLKAENKQSVLELGAGAGLESKYFQDQGFTVLATDLSEEMVKACQKLGLNAQVLDMYEISSLTQSYDAVFSMNALLHVPRKDLESVLESIHAQLNANGIFCLGLYGGVSEEKTYVDQAKMNMPRFFSFLSDNDIKAVVGKWFEVLSFDVVDIESKTPGLHFQEMLLRKK